MLCEPVAAQVGGISAEEAAALRREVEATDALLRGYQTENEAATRRIKASAGAHTPTRQPAWTPAC